MLKSRTFVATPAYRGDVVMQYAHSIVRDSVLAMGAGHFVEAPHFINDTYIHCARNKAVQTFMEGEWDYLMFIDADLGWSPGALTQIIDAPADMDVIGGVYRSKEDKPRFLFNPTDDCDFISFPVDEVGTVATGFMRITRACLERTLRLFPSGKIFNHIEDASVIGGEWGDDYAFCQRARAAGNRIFARFDITFEHVGPKAWVGCAKDDLGKVDAPPKEAMRAIHAALAANPEFASACEALSIEPLKERA